MSGPETPAEAIVLYLVVTRVMSRGLAVLPCPMSSRSSARPLPPDLSCISSRNVSTLVLDGTKQDAAELGILLLHDERLVDEAR